jgi:CzcA family heavy metal efflux pump
MKRLIELIVDNPVAAIFFTCLAVWSGVYALFHLPVGLFPGVDVPVVNVISHYPGASSEDMEMLVTRPVEDRMRTMPGIRRVASTSSEGVSQVTAEFDWGTPLSDARQLVQAELSTAQKDLPSGVFPRLENIGTTLQEVAGYVISGGGSQIALRTTAKTDLAGRLMAVEGVSSVEVLGGDDPAFTVQLRQDALAKNHLTIDRVTAALNTFNRVTADDFVERGGREYLIRGDSRLRTIEDLLDVPIISNGSNTVFLRDIADVRPGIVPRHYQVQGNGLPAVAFTISRQPGADTIRVVRDIDNELNRLKHLLPPGAQIRKFYDQSDIVSEARESLFHDLVTGALLASAVILFFMGTLRATLIVTTAIPVTLLTTLALMRLFGQTLNVITLSALTLAVGMVVDDAIIITENVTRHLQAGKKRKEATIEGTTEIAGPDASGTFTTIAAFAPLLLLNGIAGIFVRPFGLTVSIALIISLLVSLTLVPMLLGHSGSIGNPISLGSRMLSRTTLMIHRVNDFTFAHKPLAVLTGLIVLGLSGLAVFLGPVSFLPPIDEGAILIEYIMPPGTSLSESGRIGDLLEKTALSQVDVDTVYRRTGSPERGAQIEGVNRGELTIKLSLRKKRTHTINQVMDDLKREYGKIPGVVFLYHQPTQEKMDESLSGLPALFGVTMFGPDMGKLVDLAAHVEGIMEKDPALSNIVNNTKIRSPQIIVKPIPAELARCGILPDTVSESIQATRFGVLATSIMHERQPIEVLVKTGQVSDFSVEQLGRLPISTPSGKDVRLGQVADIRIDHIPSAVTHLNGQREITLLAEVDGGIPSTVDRLRNALSSLRLPEGYSLAFTGQYQMILQTVRDFIMIGIVALIMIYLIMVMQFRSWLQPLVILVNIPLALIGGIVLLVVTRIGLDISAGMGMLTLLGVSVNNGIVLIDYANRQSKMGRTSIESFQHATTVRLRPILMTAFTTIFGLLPVALNPSVGSRIFQPFAVTVIGGLVSSTVATLVFIPVLGSIVQRVYLKSE